MEKHHILVDMDETVAYLHRHCLRRWNTENPDKPMTFNDLKTWESGAVFMDYFVEGDTYRNLDVIPNSQIVLKHWHNQGHRIEFVTACPHIPDCMDAKREWVDKHFGFIGANAILFTDKKGEVGGDMLVDDSPKFLAQFQHGITVKHNRQYNTQTKADVSFSDWKDILNLPYCYTDLGYLKNRDQAIHKKNDNQRE